jgi:hypothetical protein
MSKNISDNNLATDALSALGFWEQHPDVKLKDATYPAFKRAHEAFKAAADDVVVQEGQLRQAIVERDAQRELVQDVVTRLRSAVRGIYGPDSNEYEQVGGTRARDRKRPVRAKNASLVNALQTTSTKRIFENYEPGWTVTETNGSGQRNFFTSNTPLIDSSDSLDYLYFAV